MTLEKINIHQEDRAMNELETMFDGDPPAECLACIRSYRIKQLLVRILWISIVLVGVIAAWVYITETLPIGSDHDRQRREAIS